MITARDGRLDLQFALPQSTHIPAPGSAMPADEPPTFRTAQEMEALERGNLMLALEAANWRVAGELGAAQRLRMNPFTDFPYESPRHPAAKVTFTTTFVLDQQG